MAQYDPNKKYQWSNDDKITISGRDFGLFLNAFRTILSSNQPLPVQTVILADKANSAIESIMIEYVEKDVIKEVVERPKMEVKK